MKNNTVKNSAEEDKGFVASDSEIKKRSPEEEIIELLDIVEKERIEEIADTEPEEPLNAPVDNSIKASEDITPLPNPLPTGEGELIGEDGLTKFSTALKTEAEEDCNVEELVDSLGITIGTEKKAALVQDAVSPQQVDAVLEKVARDMVAEKLEKILVPVIEKAVSAEIERLKGMLSEDV